MPTLEEQAVAVIQRQIEAYNRRDAQAFLALFVADAQIFNGWTGRLLAQGLDEIRPRYEHRFQSPVHGELLGRLVLGNIVVDREVITGLPDCVPVQCLAEYTVDVEKAQITKCVLFWGHPPQWS